MQGWKLALELHNIYFLCTWVARIFAFEFINCIIMWLFGIFLLTCVFVQMFFSILNRKILFFISFWFATSTEFAIPCFFWIFLLFTPKTIILTIQLDRYMSLCINITNHVPKSTQISPGKFFIVIESWEICFNRDDDKQGKHLPANVFLICI